MKVDKNSPLGEMLLKMAAEHDPKLRRTIRNDEVGDLNIIALGAPDDEIIVYGRGQMQELRGSQGGYTH